MQYSQFEAGIGPLLLKQPDIHLAYLTPTWILSLRQYLSCHNMTVTVSDSYTIPLHGPKGAFLTQQFLRIMVSWSHGLMIFG